jgi:hypothetical protein
MMTRPIGVLDVMERASERVRLGRSTAERTSFQSPEYHQEQRLQGVIEAVLDQLRNRDVREARRLAESVEDADLWPLEFPGWGLAKADFLPACRLVEEIDLFLHALPAFVVEFYRDIATLGVVADWCEDHGYRHASAEARHLLARLRQLL